ncbi:hypothetical protein F5J12DRAFT_705970, partial [Pisolithus orientalis]|uniref:uncharacterized protein n=1 Tax=Pisolithus orientalis TaxID=936130 RepID=UPI002223FD30
DNKLAKLSKALAEEELVHISELARVSANEATEDVDNDEGWVNEIDELTLEEQRNLERMIQPVKLALMGVRLAFKIIHSSTVVLPTWQGTLKELREPITLMPRDVHSHWN